MIRWPPAIIYPNVVLQFLWKTTMLSASQPREEIGTLRKGFQVESIICCLCQDNWLLSATRSSSSPYPAVERVAFMLRFPVPGFRYLPCGVICWQKISWSSTTLRGKLGIWLKLGYGRLLSIVSNSLHNNSLLFFSLLIVCFENVIPTVIKSRF